MKGTLKSIVKPYQPHPNSFYFFSIIRYKLFGRVTDGHRTMADCVSQHLRAQGKALVSAANCSSGNNVDADGNPIAGPSSAAGT